MKNNIKIIFVDIDWTLLNDDIMEFNQSEIDSLKQAQNNGVKVVLCTARPYASMKTTHILDIFKPDGIISANGAVIHINNKLIYQYYFEDKLMEEVAKVGDKYQVSIELIGAKNRYVTPIMSKEAKFVFSYMRDNCHNVHPFNHRKVSAINMFVPDEIAEQVINEMPKCLIYDHFFTYAYDYFFKKASKGEAIAKVLKHYNFTKENAMAIGDDYNDLEMFKEVEYSVAMGNAREIVKENAKFICDTIFENGFTNLFYKLSII